MRRLLNDIAHHWRILRWRVGLLPDDICPFTGGRPDRGDRCYGGECAECWL